VGRPKSRAMRRLLFLALLLPALLAVPAMAQTTDPTGTASCADGDDSAALTAVSGSDDGGVPAGPADTGGSSSGGTPALDSGTTVTSSGAGDVTSGAAEAPAVVVAQEPEPQPEGPGEEQPGAPGGEPQEPTVPEAPGGEAPGAETGGGLPVTGLEAFQLALLGAVLLLVGARLRVIALRRRNRPQPDPDTRPQPAPGWSEADEATYEEETAVTADVPDVPERYEWAFPDPYEPAPTGLLPSTASARRQARALAMAGDPD
jgi:hypothetical protein